MTKIVMLPDGQLRESTAGVIPVLDFHGTVITTDDVLIARNKINEKVDQLIRPGIRTILQEVGALATSNVLPIVIVSNADQGDLKSRIEVRLPEALAFFINQKRVQSDADAKKINTLKEKIIELSIAVWIDGKREHQHTLEKTMNYFMNIITSPSLKIFQSRMSHSEKKMCNDWLSILHSMQFPDQYLCGPDLIQACFEKLGIQNVLIIAYNDNTRKVTHFEKLLNPEQGILPSKFYQTHSPEVPMPSPLFFDDRESNITAVQKQYPHIIAVHVPSPETHPHFWEHYVISPAWLQNEFLRSSPLWKENLPLEDRVEVLMERLAVLTPTDPGYPTTSAGFNSIVGCVNHWFNTITSQEFNARQHKKLVDWSQRWYRFNLALPEENRRYLTITPNNLQYIFQWGDMVSQSDKAEQHNMTWAFMDFSKIRKESTSPENWHQWWKSGEPWWIGNPRYCRFKDARCSIQLADPYSLEDLNSNSFEEAQFKFVKNNHLGCVKECYASIASGSDMIARGDGFRIEQLMELSGELENYLAHMPDNEGKVFQWDKEDYWTTYFTYLSLVMERHSQTVVENTAQEGIAHQMGLSDCSMEENFSLS